MMMIYWKTNENIQYCSTIQIYNIDMDGNRHEQSDQKSKVTLLFGVSSMLGGEVGQNRILYYTGAKYRLLSIVQLGVGLS